MHVRNGSVSVGTAGGRTRNIRTLLRSSPVAEGAERRVRVLCRDSVLHGCSTGSSLFSNTRTLSLFGYI